MIEQILEADRMLQVDQVERAREIYERVTEMDPGNAIAVVGLAECALAEEDDALAYELAAKALSIDPENDKARRMEARLSEILATRGEAVERPQEAATLPAHQMRPLVTEAATASADGADGADGSADTPSPPEATSTPASSTTSPVRKTLWQRLLGR